MKAIPKQIPKVWSVMGPTSSSGCTAPEGTWALEVAHGIDRRPVHAHLEVEVVAEAVAGAADRADHLTLAHRAAADAEAAEVGVAGGDGAAVLYADEVAV